MRNCFAKTALCQGAIALTLFLPLLLPQGRVQAAPNLNRTTSGGDQYLEQQGAEVHIKPRMDKSGPSNVNATAALSLPDAHTWTVSFNIRFGNLQDQASSCHLTRGGTDIGWIGADGFNKQMGVFLGKDGEVVAQTPDTEWHHLVYKSAGGTLTASLAGKPVGSGPAQDVPDSVTLKNGQDMNVPCHQEGVWVRDVQLQDTPQSVSQAGGQHEAVSPQRNPQQEQLQKQIDQQKALILSLRKQLAGKKSVRASRLTHVASLSHRAGSGMRNPPATKRTASAAPSVIFFDDFSDDRRTALQWQEDLNEGTVSYTGSGISLGGDGKGCPMLRARTSPLPAAGNWTATFAFRYTRIAPYGTSLGLVNAKGDFIARVHQGDSGQFLQVSNQNVATHPADTDWHVVSFAKKPGMMAVYLDGTKAGEAAVADVPLSLCFGGYHVDSPGPWNNQEVQFVRVDSGERVFDKTALSSFGPISVATIENVPSSSGQTIPPALAKNVADYNEVLLRVRALMRHCDAMNQMGDRAQLWLQEFGGADPADAIVVAQSGIQFAQNGLDGLDGIRSLLLHALSMYNSMKNDPELYQCYQNGDLCTTLSYIDADLGMLGAADLRFLVQVR